MKSICFYFQLHQPYRIRPYSYFEIGHNHDYFDQEKNCYIVQKVNQKSYRPMLFLLWRLLKKYPDFRFSLSITGTLIEQWQEYSPDLIELIKKIAVTGQVEFLAETYYHSLSYLWSYNEWHRQVIAHRALIRKLFNQTPQVFRNTELVFENRLAPQIARMGFKGVLVEGANHILQGRSPTHIYKALGQLNLKFLVKHYQLSDDIAFRFSNRDWQFYPLHSDRYYQWLQGIEGQIINLFMDFETFGEHQWADSGIFDFFGALIGLISDDKLLQFLTPIQVFQHYQPIDVLDIPYPVSWADTERDLSAWLGNNMQSQASSTLYGFETEIIRSQDDELIADWRKLQTSDHFYYMCTKWFADGDVHKYFNPYTSPYDAYIYYQLILEDLKWRLENQNSTRRSNF